MRLLKTRTSVNDVANHKKKGKRGSYAQDQGKIMLPSTRTMANKVVKHKNKCKLCCQAQEQWQKKLRSI